MEYKKYIAKMKMIQKQYMFNVDELAEYFGIAKATIIKFRNDSECKLQWATEKKIKERIDTWEAQRGAE